MSAANRSKPYLKEFQSRTLQEFSGLFFVITKLFVHSAVKLSYIKYYKRHCETKHKKYYFLTFYMRNMDSSHENYEFFLIDLVLNCVSILNIMKILWLFKLLCINLLVAIYPLKNSFLLPPKLFFKHSLILVILKT